MKNILHFDNMLTPKIITFIYWVLLLVAVIGGFGSMFSSFNGLSFTSIITGIIYIIAGVIGARIWCELLIVLFKMNEALQVLKEK